MSVYNFTLPNDEHLYILIWKANSSEMKSKLCSFNNSRRKRTRRFKHVTSPAVSAVLREQKGAVTLERVVVQERRYSDWRY
jgi:hypothetical protein